MPGLGEAGWICDADGVLRFLGRLGLAAILTTADGQVCRANAAGEHALGDGVAVTNGRLRVHGSVRALLQSAIANAAADARPSVPIALPRDGGRRPLLTRAFSLDCAPGAGAGVAVLVLFDPEDRQPTRSEAGFRLLGLTEAQARIAAMIGWGLSPREAAHCLGRSEATVRTTLGNAYIRLQISRQSELSLLAVRLANLGG